MKVFRTVAVMMLLAWPVHALAEDDHVHRAGEEQKPKSPNEIAAEREAEKSYKRSLSNIPDQAPVDPWGNARAAEAAPKEAPKAHAKAVQATPAKPRTNAGSSTSTNSSTN